MDIKTKTPILVTGANGFLGSSIITELFEDNLTVWGTDIGPQLQGHNVSYKRADITKWEGLTAVTEGAATVIHAAGLAHIFVPDRRLINRFHKVNSIGTKNVVKAAAKTGVKHFILISSVAVYGPFTHGMCSEDAACTPIGPYAESKYDAELKAIEIAQYSGMALTILRLATLYGECDPGNISRLIRSIDQGRFIWIGGGQNQKSLLYKGDAAKACRTVALAPLASGVRVFNLSGPPCTMREIVDTLCVELGKRPFPGKVPASMALRLSRVLSTMPVNGFKNIHGTIKKWLAEDVYDTSLFEKTFGFKPEVGIEEGLRREVEWYRQAKQY